MPKVLVTDNTSKAALPILKEVAEVDYIASLTAEELRDTIGEYDALIIRSASKVTPEILEHAQNLKIVGRAGVGTDNIDLPIATQRGIIVVNSPEGNTIAAAEHTLALLFSLARHVPEGDRSMKVGEWKRKALTGVELYGKTLGVIGLGKIGSHVAKVATSAGMRVLVFDPFLTQSKVDALGIKRADALEDIWAQADFITVHVPKNKDTLNLINSKTLALCKPGVRLINCSRGGIINEADLVEAIQSGHVAGAALDVFEQEPPPPDHPLLQLGSKIITTPHLGASTEEAQLNVAIDVAEQIRDYFKEGYARSAVNIPQLRKDVLDPVRHFMPLAEVLGKLVRQLAKGPTQAVEITAKGNLSDKNCEPLALAILKGIISLSREGVTYVNAPVIAEERGIDVQQTKSKNAGNYTNLITVKLTTDQEVHTVSGTVISENMFRVVDIDDYPVTLEATQNILFTPHADKPGMIGHVATILGQHSVNVSAMQVARKGTHAGGQSFMAFNTDNPVSDEILAEICKVDGIFDAFTVRI